MPEQEFRLKEPISKLPYLEKSRLEFFNIHTSSDQIVYFSFFFFFFWRRGGGDQVFASQAQVETKEEIFGWNWLHKVQLLATHLLHKVHSCSGHKYSPVAEAINTFTAFPFPFIFVWD